MRKSLTFGALHLVIAVTVGYAISGSFVLAGAIALVEPLVNTVAHYFFDRWWNARESAATAPGEAGHGPRRIAASAGTRRVFGRAAARPGLSASGAAA